MNVCIRPSANSIKMKRVVRLETSVCLRITRLTNNQIQNFDCVSQASDALVSQERKSRRNPMQKVSGSIQRVRFTMSYAASSELSEKRKDHRWEKQMSKFLISEVPTLWHLRTGPMNNSSDVPEARLGILLKSYTSKEEKDKAAFCFPATGCVNKRAGGKKSLWLIPERVCIWSVRKILTLLSWRP